MKTLIEQKTDLVTYTLYEYEVWGNKKDGYEVNNVFLVETIEASKDLNNEDILKLFKLRRGVFINHDYCNETHIELINKSRKPLGNIRIGQ